MKSLIIKASLTILISLIFLFWIIKEVEDIKFNKKFYRVEVIFRSVAGLQKKAEVRLGGLKIGEVTDIVLNPENNKISVFIKLEEKIKIKKNSLFMITSESFLGVEKYLEIVPQEGKDIYLKDGDRVIGEDPIEAKDVIRRMNKTFENLQILTDVVEELVKERNLGEVLNNIFKNIESLTKNTDILMSNINEVVQTNRADLKILVGNLKVISENLKEITSNLKQLTSDKKVSEDIKKIIENTRKSTEKIERMTDTLEKEIINKENLRGVGETLKSVGDKVKKIKEFNYSPSVQISRRESGNYKTVLNFDILQKKDIFYNIGLEDVTESEKLNLQIGKKFPKGIYLRGGIKRGEEGIGIDYRDNYIFLKTDLFDFDKPKLNLESGLKVTPHLYFFWGLENLNQKKKRENLFGIEIR
jgi:phospholipid/cholesterol/gamma-HCH transport system substrate-binding protein